MDSGSLKETVVNVPVPSCALELFGSSDSKDFESLIFLEKNGQLRNLFSAANYEIEVSEMHLAEQLNPVELSDCSLQSEEDYYLNIECSSIQSDLALANTNVDLASSKLSAINDPPNSVPFTSLSSRPASPESNATIDNEIHMLENGSCIQKDSCVKVVESPVDKNSSPIPSKCINKNSNVTVIETSSRFTDKNGIVKRRTISKKPLPGLLKYRGSKKITKITALNSLISKKLAMEEKRTITQTKCNVKEPSAIVCGYSGEEILPSSNKTEEKIQDYVLQQLSSSENSSEPVKPNTASDTADDKPVNEALEKMGISDEELNKLQMDIGNQKVWFCPQNGCMFNAARISWLKTHLLTHFETRPYKCDHENCSWSFFSLVKLKRHKETHLKKKSHKCEMCERSFTTVYNLHTHLKLHKRPADLTCPVEECKVAFQTKRSLELHLRVHKEIPAPYRCERKDCGKSYYSRNALRSHSRGHIYSEEDLKCSFCNKLFDKPCRLKAHVRSHTGVKPYRCKFEGCSWAFTTSSKLSRHMCKHTNIRKYPCSIENCGKSFLRPEHLRDHVLTHFTEKAFACPVDSCNGAFSARSSLYVHLKKVHNNAKDGETKKVGVGDGANCHSCVIKGCDYQFSSKEDLKSHLIYQHVHSAGSVSTSETLPVVPFIKSETVDMSSINPLDSMHLLGNDENLGSLIALTCSNDESSISGINLNLGPEGLSVSLPELVSNNTDFNSISPSFVQSMTSEKILNSPEEEPKLPGRIKCKQDEIVLVSNTDVSAKKPLSSTVNIADSMTSLLNNSGCARTNITLKDILNKVNSKRVCANGKLKRQTLESNDNLRTELSKTALISSQQDSSLSPCLQASDVVLPSSWLDDNLSPLMLQDDLNGSAELYETNQDDSALMGAPSNELQVFLFDSGASSRHCDFEQSTINLRDLE